jgi:multicomponent Na+:H+ antiporter subunit D
VAGVLLVTAGPVRAVVTGAGRLGAPVGIALVADRLSALLLLVSTLVALAVLVYAISQRIADYGRHIASSTFYPMYLALSAGVSLAYLSGDLFTLFVSFEVMLTASYVLITRRTSERTIRAGMTYVTVSLLSSLLFLTAVGLVYAATATVNLADLSGRLGTIPPGLRNVLALMLMVVFGIKAAMVPLHFWLPDSYPNAPAPVTALFAGLLTKVSFYAMLRTQTLLFPHDRPWTLMLWFAVATMIIGALGASRRTTSTGSCRSCWSAHRIHALRARGLRRPRPVGRDALRRPPHHGAGHAVPRQRSDRAADRHRRAGPDGRAPEDLACPRRAVRRSRR